MTLHFVGPLGHPVGTDEIQTRDDVSAGVIDGPFRRVTVAVAQETVCLSCTDECDHAARVEGALNDATAPAP